MTIHQLLIQWLLLCVVVIEATKLEFPSGSDGDRFTNMAIHDGKIYIGAKNYIYILNADNLSEMGDKVSTCTGECNNINKVLVINEKLNQLISCGTEHYGTCQIRSLNNIRTVQNTSSNDPLLSSYLVVSTMEKRPASFLVTMNIGGLYTGVTYGPGVKPEETSGFNSYFNYLSNYSLVNTEFMKEQYLKFNLFKDNSVDTTPEKYLVYFKASFEEQGYVHFVTNQKFKVGDTNYTSKLIRLCQNDSNFWSYTDIELQCVKNDTVYNLIQDVSILKIWETQADGQMAIETVMAATFASGSDPESPERPSAVCLYNYEEIDQNIMKAKVNFFSCPGSSWTEREAYLLNEVTCSNDLNRTVSYYFILGYLSNFYILEIRKRVKNNLYGKTIATVL